MTVRTVIAVAAMAAVVLGATTISAQTPAPIEARKALMKTVGQQTGAGAAMVKGEAAYDQAKAQAIFATYVDAAEKFPTMFPDNSKTGGDTAALPAIWEKMAEFKAIATKLGTDAKAAQGAVKDLDTFKASFGEVTKNCGACHQTFRARRS